MSTSASLQSLLHRPDLWRGRDPSAGSRPAVLPTGFASLDTALHHGGWPAYGLSEVLCDALCPLRLLFPALARAAGHGLVVLANPPALPGAQAWASAGVSLSQLLLISSAGADKGAGKGTGKGTGKGPDQNALLRRACLEAASSDAVAALMLWLPASERDPRLLRRLHRAAQQGRCWLVVIREQRFRQQSSAAPLRLHLTPEGAGMQLTIIKQPGGWAGQQLTLPWLPEALQAPRQATAHLAAPAHMSRAAPVVTPVIPQPAPAPEPPEHRLGLPGKDTPPPALALPGRPAGDAPPATEPVAPGPPPEPAHTASRTRQRRRPARAGH